MRKQADERVEATLRSPIRHTCINAILRCKICLELLFCQTDAAGSWRADSDHLVTQTRSGIVQECCLKQCSYTYLLSFCDAQMSADGQQNTITNEVSVEKIAEATGVRHNPLSSVKKL
ncbi:hypothetical protein D917_05168 [Trichinella nativa]|uniref:Insulin-like domain-containing protein n=1 Tax=Trichinella nativa TaxID=6335 RepID=A0A1Y3F1X5_9BILA|nr:hypothetical protein D917_05168 [Trichinella nativa]